jgi:glycerate 2-kinase
VLLDLALTVTRTIFDAAVSAVDARAAVARGICEREGELRVPAGGRLLVVAVGKAAARMARAAEDILGDRIAAGLGITKYGHGEPTSIVAIREASHPTPDAAGVTASMELAAMLQGATADDVVLCLVSGGGSALLTSPAPGITLAELSATTSALLASGAPIEEVNGVRKHLEVLKGGGLARLAAPARVVALIISDVVGDPLDVIASGPTVGDESTFEGALSIVRERRLQVPASVLARLSAGARGEIAETPRAGDPLFERVHNIIVASPSIAAQAAAEQAKALGWEPQIFDLTVTGEAREVGTEMAARLLAARSDRRLCLIGAGETTVTVRGKGLGGRNTELVLSAARTLAGLDGVSLASLATDGDDGPTKAAGAVAVGETIARGHALGMNADDYLGRNDSARYFQGAGGLLITGPTLTNVADLYVGLATART